MICVALIWAVSFTQLNTPCMCAGFNQFAKECHYCQVLFCDSERVKLRSSKKKKQASPDQTEDLGFNEIKPWLTKRMRERRLSVDKLCMEMDNQIVPNQIRRWFRDECRPYQRSMVIVCETLSRLPVYKVDGSTTFKTVRLSEGLSKYSPKPRAWAAHKLKKPSE